MDHRAGYIQVVSSRDHLGAWQVQGGVCQLQEAAAHALADEAQPALPGGERSLLLSSTQEAGHLHRAGRWTGLMQRSTASTSTTFSADCTFLGNGHKIEL